MKKIDGPKTLAMLLVAVLALPALAYSQTATNARRSAPRITRGAPTASRAAPAGGIDRSIWEPINSNDGATASEQSPKRSRTHRAKFQAGAAAGVPELVDPAVELPAEMIEEGVGQYYEDGIADYGVRGHRGWWHGCLTDWLFDGRERFFVGAEYLLVRPSFSEGRAFVRGTTVPPVNNVARSIEETIFYNYDYRSSYRTYFGWRLADCCSEVRFTFTDLDGGKNISATTATGSNVNNFIWEVLAPPGQTLTARNNVGGQVYDLDFSRCIRNRDECCDPCSCCKPCPSWDLRWSAGVRAADMGYDNFVTTTFIANGSQTPATVAMRMNFSGAGPKVGLEGRRYFGACGQFSFYSMWDFALLVGTYEHRGIRTETVANVVTTQETIARTTRVIPVTDIELGLSWKPRACWEISAGYFAQVWWDLGMSEDQGSQLGASGFFLDDANIMAWDGLSIRAEYTF